MPHSPARAIIFDLDGTLVETERLKAQAYAATLKQLLGLDTPDDRAIALYERLVGSTDEMICRAVLAEIPGVEGSLSSHPGEEPWLALHSERMNVYSVDFGNEAGLTGARYEHNLGLLQKLAATGLPVAVATSSFTDEADRVLRILGVRHVLAALVGREQVANPKPSPDIYLETCRRLGANPADAVTIEDSPLGVASARAAGTRWICVPTPFSRQAIAGRVDIDQAWVVQDAADLDRLVDLRIRGGERV